MHHVNEPGVGDLQAASLALGQVLAYAASQTAEALCCATLLGICKQLAGGRAGVLMVTLQLGNVMRHHATETQGQ